MRWNMVLDIPSLAWQPTGQRPMNFRQVSPKFFAAHARAFVMSTMNLSIDLPEIQEFSIIPANNDARRGSSEITICS